MAYAPVKGDRVRVVIEGEVKQSGRDFFEISDESREKESWCSTYVRPEADYFVSVEKIEPPVTVFKPGDVVRAKTSSLTYLILDRGWASLGPAWTSGGGLFHGESDREFTSKNFELVDFPE